MDDKKRNSRKVLTGIVKKKSGIKTLSVLVEHVMRHPVIKKVIKVHKKYLVHDDLGTVKVGTEVKIVQVRPISKKKHWRIINDSN